MKGGTSRETRAAHYYFQSLMNETPLSERLKEIRDLVALLTPIPDMALLLGVHERTLRDELDDLSSPVSLAYRQAKAEIALKLRQRDIELAEAGSTTAAENVVTYFHDMLREE